MPAALLGGLLLALLIIRLGRRSFSPQLFGVSLFAGVLGAIPVLLFAIFTAKLKTPLSPLWQTVFDAFISAGLFEETAKLAAIYCFVRSHYLRRTSIDLVLGAASVALGFALLENVIYVVGSANNWQSLALLRAAMSVPTHAFLGLLLGRGLVRAEHQATRARSRAVLARTLLLAAFLHGCYDLPIMLLDRAPSYPPQVMQLASALSLTVPTLLDLGVLASLAGLCMVALRIVFSLDLLESSNSRPSLTTAPGRLVRIICSTIMGRAIAFPLLIGSIVILAISLEAFSRGVLAVLPLAACALCLAPGSLGLAFLMDARTTRPVSPSYMERAESKGWSVRMQAGVALILVIAGILILQSPWRWLQANLLVISAYYNTQNGSLDVAIENDDAALSLKPDFDVALAGRAEVNRVYQRYDQALVDIDKALAINPDNIAFLAFRSSIHSSLHDSRAAAMDLDRALSIKPNDALLLSQRAEAAYYLHDKALAEVEFAAALKAGPNSAEVHIDHGEILLAQGRLDDAVEEFNTALRLAPDSAQARFLRARVYYYRGDYRPAIADLAFANNQLSGPYPALWLFLTRMHEGQDGRSELALRSNRLSETAWPAPLVQLYLGKQTADEARTKVKNADQACEADFYIGELLLLRKETEEEATVSLRRAAVSCPETFIEFEAAAAELRKLETAQKAKALQDFAARVSSAFKSPAGLPGQAKSGNSPNALPRTRIEETNSTPASASSSTSPRSAFPIAPSSQPAPSTNMRSPDPLQSMGRTSDLGTPHPVQTVVVKPDGAVVPNSAAKADAKLAANANRSECPDNTPDETIAGCTVIIDRDEGEIAAARTQAKAGVERQYRAISDDKYNLAGYDKVIEIGLELAASYESRAAAHRALHDDSNARIDSERGAALRKQMPEAFFARGNIYGKLAVRDHSLADHAIDDYTRVITFNRAHLGAYLARANVHGVKHDFEAAIFDYDRALEIDPKSRAAIVGRVSALFTSKDAERAILDASDGLALYPRDENLLFFRGQAYEARGSHELALADYNAAIAINPGFAFAYFKRGEIQHAKGEFQSALPDYDKAIGIDPRPAYYFLVRSFAYRCMGDGGHAEADLNKAKSISAETVTAYSGHLDDCSLALEQAQAIAAPDAKELLDQGLAAFEKGDLDRAIAYFDRAIAINPKFGAAYRARAQAFDLKGDIERSLAEFGLAISADPSDVDALFGRGLAYFYEGRFIESEIDLRRAFEMRPEPYQALWLYFASGRNGRNEVNALRSISAQNGGVQWPVPLINLLLNASLPDASPPEDAMSSSRKPEQLCEEKFFLAEWHLLNGADAKAASMFREAATICPKNYVEYSATIAELKRLKI
ncbi:MAG: tetratricopeptide repeat protein [Hyphomicrobiales bacterium]|nr:tetratricopeptide repeat protein [Hyphomicrobiales bacterium]